MSQNYQVMRSALANNIKIVTIDLPHLHTVTTSLYVRNGARFENPLDNGLSHFVEHMLYRGTERFPTSFDLNFAFESLGSSLHAETGRDYSLYQVTAGIADTSEVLGLLAELITKPRFDDIDLERSLIVEEANEDYDENGVEINSSDIGRRRLFGDHGLGQRIIGPRENLDRFDREDIKRHHQTYYCGNNLLLAVAGPLVHEPVVRAAETSFAAVPTGSFAKTCAPPPSQGLPSFEHVSDSGSQTSLDMLFRSIPEDDPQFVASIALLRILDDGMASRLHYQLCDQKGLAYSLGASIEPFFDAAIFEIGGATSHAKLPTLVRETFALLDEFRKHPVDDRELQKAKQRYRFDLESAVDDPGAMVGWFGGAALYSSPPSLTEKSAAMEAVTKGDIMCAAKRVFATQNLAIITVGTLSEAQRNEIKSAIAEF